MHYFLLGPSGVGKTTFGDWLQDNCQYLHIPVDRGDRDNGLVTEGLIELWNKLLEGASTAS
jgi:adenylate kinase family enzyme